jgi:hypothetical protein
MKRKARADSPAGERTSKAPRSTHHHVHHSGPYMDIDGDFDIVYGDGTPGSLADALADPPSDRWRPEHSPWDTVRASWESMWQSDDGTSRAVPSTRSQTADEERT